MILAVGAACSLRAWPFFVQKRVGRRGRVFRIVKIRTLPPSTPAYADKYEISTVRVPWFCATLRHLHLDELPQLYLVPAGRMSLVGPRPEMPGLHSQFEPRFASLRTSVRPGCTGLWQLSEDTTTLIRETPLYDQVYLAGASVRLDLWVLWRTALMVCRIGTPLSLEQLPQWATREPQPTLAKVIDLRPAERDEELAEDLAFDA